MNNAIKCETGNIRLPVTRDKLANFVSGLLGSPKALEKKTILQFDIDLDWIIDVCHTIDQRVKQNESSLIGFRSVIELSDGRRRTLSSLEDLASYREVNQIRSTAVSIDMHYLIQFPDSDIPKKQVIYFELNENNSCSYRIDFTEHTWAHDIENILNNKFEFAKREPILGDKSSFFATCGLAILIGAAYLYGLYIYIEYSNLSWKTETYKNIESAINNSNSQKEIAIEIIKSILKPPFSESLGHFIHYYVAPFFASIVIFTFFYIFSAIFSSRYRKSFVNLNEFSNRYRDLKIKRDKQRLSVLIFGYILSILASIIASIISRYIGM